MPSSSEKQRIAMAIAEHEPEKLYKKNKYAILLIKCYAIALFTFVFLADIPVFAFRICYVFLISEIILIPLLIYLFKPRWILKIMVILVSVAYFLIEIVYNQIVNPYI